MKRFWLLLVAISSTTASYCGESGVPFSLEVLPSGLPVLGCAQPTCVAQSPDDVDDSKFNIDDYGQSDGFFREGDRQRHGYLQTNKLRPNCSHHFNAVSCPRKNQWVGGIDYLDTPNDQLRLRCCQFDGLRYSQNVGVTTIGAGEAVTGGEVIREGRQISFDVIANIRKVVDPSDGRIVFYEVTVRRMNCLPDPPEIETPIAEEVYEEVIRVLEEAGNGDSPLGHEGHAHMDKELLIKEQELEEKIERVVSKPRRKHGRRQRLPQKSSRSSIPERSENFVGSFAATIYKPDESDQDLAVSPHTRHIPSPPKRVSIDYQPEPTVQIEPTTPSPFIFPTLPTFTFPTLPPVHNNIFQFAPPVTMRPLPQAFGVSQANLNPLPPPTTQLQFPLMFQQPYNPFLPQPQQSEPIPPSPISHDYGIIQPQQQQYGIFSQQQIQGQSSLSQIPRFPGLPGFNQQEREQQVPPTHQNLGQLYLPPPFLSLNNALTNFQNQG